MAAFVWVGRDEVVEETLFLASTECQIVSFCPAFTGDLIDMQVGGIEK